jgi:indole-3-glycerol phosphate synthase
VRSLIGFPKAGVSVLGINNRNLSTMQVDLGTTERLASLLDAPNGLVAESGIKTPEHVEILKRSGATAVLIGQTLCEHPDIAEQFKMLFG